MPGTPANPEGIYELDWDGNPAMPPNNNWWLQRDPNHPDRIRVAQRPQFVRDGEFVARFELHDTDRFNTHARSELSSAATDAPQNAPDGLIERWYGFSIYLQDWAEDPAPDIVTQWHHDPEGSCNPDNGSPPLAIMTRDDQWLISVRDFARSQNHTIDIPVGPYQKNRWTDWVVHVKWSGGDEGKLTIWKDGVPVEGISPDTGELVSFDGKTGQNCFARFGNYMKIGIYKWPWNQAQPDPVSNQTQRVMFHDELRIAGEDGTSAAVAPQRTLIKKLVDLNIEIGEAEKRGDTDYFQKLLHDDLSFRRANKTIANKEQFLADLGRTENTIEELTVSDVEVTLYEVTAVISLLVHASGNKAESGPWQGIYRNTRIFLQEGDEWKLAFWFNTRIGDLPGIE